VVKIFDSAMSREEVSEVSILKWKNFDEMLSIKDDIDRLFDRMFEKTSFSSWEERYALISSGAPSPEFNIYRRGENTVIQANLPGFEKGDIKVSVSGNLLAIGSEVSREREFRGNNAYRYHRSHGSFCKVMELPVGADANNIRSSFNDGVLEVVIPKMGSIESQTREPVDTSLTMPPDLLPDGSDEE
jgi:HSP20 family protein